MTKQTELSYYKGRCVLVTGGGGSIGGGLCRELLKAGAGRLIIFDIYENGAHEVKEILSHSFPESEIIIEIGSIRDRERLEGVFRRYRPSVVFHAAAHKHVHLMETAAGEAVKNNVFGTYNAVLAAEKYGAERFILISSDKASSPAGVMGATKRLCERIVSSRRGKTVFASVRFGNVKGSSGSVIPMFERQIRGGGPLTVTDKGAMRYFMSAEDACHLVMTAAVRAGVSSGGEIFVLDMGEPINIYELAVEMIKSAGLVPDVDIKIELVGLRPGEKLIEMPPLPPSETVDTGGGILLGADTPVTAEAIEAALDALRSAVRTADETGDDSELRRVLYESIE